LNAKYFKNNWPTPITLLASLIGLALL